jgi:hypothetical protein
MSFASGFHPGNIYGMATLLQVVISESIEGSVRIEIAAIRKFLQLGEPNSPGLSGRDEIVTTLDMGAII